MSWGHIVSRDLVSWAPVGTLPALETDEEYDRQGVFTGCWVPSRNLRDASLTVAYSSVKELPFHWSTPPYPRNAAGLALATSHDGGQTWVKHPRNPILKGEPPGVQVTGFRDPYVTELPCLDLARGVSSPKHYGLISGGIQDVGPTSFCYEIQEGDFQCHWNYLGPLVELPLRFQPSKAWSGNYGVNWECTNMFTLRATSEARNFLLIGAEGDVERDHIQRFTRGAEAPSRTVRSQLWMSGHFETTAKGAKFRYSHGGYFDHGSYYAANSFLDPVSGRRVVYGWIPEEDITVANAKRKGWNGSLAMPREIFLLRIHGVYGTIHSALASMTCFEVTPEPDGTNSIMTLGVKPIDEMLRLRGTYGRKSEMPSPLQLPDSGNFATRPLFQTESCHWELEAIVSISRRGEKVGFQLFHGEETSAYTTVAFSMSQETITVDREHSNTDPTINKCPEVGKFTLLRTRTSDSDDNLTFETLRLRIFFDSGIMEVFANDRFALATMVYSPDYLPCTSSVALFAKGEMGSVTFQSVQLWDNLRV